MQQALDARTIISYTRTPNVHQSTVFVYPWFIRSSGAIYSGVPQNADHTNQHDLRDNGYDRDDALFVFSVSDMLSLHRPKSQREMWPV